MIPRKKEIRTSQGQERSREREREREIEIEIQCIGPPSSTLQESRGCGTRFMCTCVQIIGTWDVGAKANDCSVPSCAHACSRSLILLLPVNLRSGLHRVHSTASQLHSLCMKPSGEASTTVTPLQRDHFRRHRHRHSHSTTTNPSRAKASNSNPFTSSQAL